MLFGTPGLRSDAELDRCVATALVQMDNLRRAKGKRLCSGELRFSGMRLAVGLAVAGLQYFVVCLN
jgi:hypothetical protein